MRTDLEWSECGKSRAIFRINMNVFVSSNQQGEPALATVANNDENDTRALLYKIEWKSCH